MPDDKTLTVTNTEEALAAGIMLHGNTELWRCVLKAHNQAEGWMKSTKVCAVPGGCVVQVTTQQRNNSGSWSIAEALTYVPGATVDDFKYNHTKDDGSQGPVLSSEEIAVEKERVVADKKSSKKKKDDEEN